MKNLSIIIVSLATISVVIHLIPFIIYSQHPLGYDTGFYRRYLIQPFTSFPNTPVPGLGTDALGPRIFLDILRLSRLPTDVVLYGGYVFLFIAQALALFFLVKHYWGSRIGFLAALLLITSPIQYTAYWFMLFKNAFGIAAMLLAFLFIEKRSHWAVPLAILVVISHHTTSIIFLITLGLFLIINKERRKEILIIFIGALAAFLYLHPNAYQEYIQLPVAVFMEYREYFVLSLPFLVLALLGIKEFLHKYKSVFVSFAIAASFFPFLSLPFYERIFIFTDIVVIVIGAIGLQKMIVEIKNHPKITMRIASLLIIVIATGGFLINSYGRIKNLRPPLITTELEEIRGIQRRVPASAAIITSTVLAPWVHGWTQNRVFAPGLLHDAHSIQEWVSFSEGLRETKIDFLKDFPRPLYIFIGPPEKDAFLVDFRECVLPESAFLFRYTCG